MQRLGIHATSAFNTRNMSYARQYSSSVHIGTDRHAVKVTLTNTAVVQNKMQQDQVNVDRATYSQLQIQLNFRKRSVWKAKITAIQLSAHYRYMS